MRKDLKPIAELQKIDDSWMSTGVDPQFLIPIKASSKLIRIMFSGKRLEQDGFNEDWISKVYFDYGSGFRENASVSFKSTGAKFHINAVCELRQPIVAIRFDPMEGSGKFILDRFSVIPQRRQAISSIRDFRSLLAPVNQVEQIERHRWRSLGPDPHFHMGIKSNAPALQIELHLRFYGEAKTPKLGKTQIFFDFGIGFNEQNSYSLYPTGPELKAVFSIPTHGPVGGIRLDPIDRACEFDIVKFRVREISKFAHASALRARVSRYALRKDSVRRWQLLTSAALAKPDEVQEIYDRVLSENGAPDAYHWWLKCRGEPDTKVFSSLVEENIKFSFIMPTYNPPMEFLAKAVRSVLRQTYGNWELCIVDDGSKSTDSLTSYVKKIAAGDNRIKLKLLPKNVGISAVSNEALQLSTGDFIALLDQDDEIAPHALSAIAMAIQDNPDADWLYSDEDKIDQKDRRFAPYFKPDWSPAFFLSCMYTCHLGVYRKSLVDKVGGFRSKYDFAQDYDLALRISREARNIVHVPDVLYHWRVLPQSTASGADAKPTAEIRAKAALQEFLDTGPYRGTIGEGRLRGTHRPRFEIPEKPMVSIAIPSAGGSFMEDGIRRWFVLDLVNSIREKSSYHNIEIVVADNDDFAPELTKLLQKHGVRIVHFKYERFNLAEKMNFVVSAATGQYVVIMNDDMTVINSDWIEEMLMWCQQDDVAGVGAKLIFPDGKIQHAGVLMLGQGPSHPFYLHDDAHEVGLTGNAVAAHEASVVTGACLMVRKKDYQDVGGFDPFFRINYNDVDFCLRLRQKTGKRIVWTPYARIYHYESVSREEPPKGELEALEERWGFGQDPYYNRHLSPFSNCYEIGMDVLPINEDYGRKQDRQASR